MTFGKALQPFPSWLSGKLNKPSFLVSINMPQMNPIAISDGKSTPVVHTFNPSNDKDGVGTYYNAVATTLIGREKLIVDPSASTPNGKARKSVLNLYLPVEITDVAGKVSVARQTLVRIEMYTGVDSTTTERNDALILAKNLLANADIFKVLVTAEGIW